MDSTTVDAAREKQAELGAKTADKTAPKTPKSGPLKAVSIAEPESISPLLKGTEKDVDQFNLDQPVSPQRQHRVRVAKSPFGRPSAESLVALRPTPSEKSLMEDSESSIGRATHRRHRAYHGLPEGLFHQIQSWIQHEKVRRAGRKGGRKSKGATNKEIAEDEAVGSKERRDSETSDGSLALEKLQEILEKANFSTESIASSRKGSALMRRVSSRAKLRRTSTVCSSDPDFSDSECFVPSCDVVLDNSKTLAYSGGTTESAGESTALKRVSSSKVKDGWKAFKYEIVRLTHTLRIHGWRRVPMERSSEIEVERLSGALTNAVYVVSPPKDLSLLRPRKGEKSESSHSLASRKPPQKLLLRVYGPQVEHLIDREAELQILRRLARKNIGPRLLGTFNNGRFEQFFHARTLTPRDLRDPDTSRQIAKRMRELHEGIELLPQERADGPFVWRNWDKWVERCEQVIQWLDEKIISENQGPVKSKLDEWKKRGLVCGVEWPVFRQTVEKYRKWLDKQYGGKEEVKNRLVFSHNDTQYGNILRLVPPGESPLMLPANKHKQLVVIDFEYANANLPGIEFANHFTEWCYNYHDANAPFACNTNHYPTFEEQTRFIRAYVEHRPFQSRAHSGSDASSRAPSQPQTPPLPPRDGSMSSSAISSFMLDARSPPVASPGKYEIDEADRKAEEEADREIRRLLRETKLWRLANSAQWVAWGIVQAKIPGMEALDSPTPTKETRLNPIEEHGGPGDGQGDRSRGDPGRQLSPDQATDTRDEEGEAAAADLDDKRPEEAEDDEEFDYLGYAQERAMFFWGDAVAMGFIGRDELPEEVLKRVKFVDV